MGRRPLTSVGSESRLRDATALAMARAHGYLAWSMKLRIHLIARHIHFSGLDSAQKVHAHVA